MVFKNISFIPTSIENIKDKAFSLSRDLEKAGFRYNLLYSLAELLRNSYEHGNKGDLSKEIIFKKDIKKDKAEFVISDYGRFIDPLFFDYLKHLKDFGFFNSKSFYDFKGILPSKGHGGVGIKMAYEFFDFVNYAKTSIGGLEVYLVKFK